tara:strand:- start:4342 stop:5961 length:1620 start_codon:yes stop_codon:yes gene_type:complete
MAASINSIDRFPTTNNDLVEVGNRIFLCRNTGSLILELEVNGTHFPSLSGNYNFAFSVFECTNIFGKSGSIFIDYADGTGEHEYPFKESTDFKMRLAKTANNQLPPNPTRADYSEIGFYNYPIYFFDDIDPSVPIDDNYPVTRKIKIRFPRFQDLLIFNLRYTGLLGELPSAIGRFRNLDSLSIFRSENLDSLGSDFDKVFCKNLTLGGLGFSFSVGIPEFILNSNSLEYVNLNSAVTLSGTNSESKLDRFFSNELPNLNGFDLSSTKIDTRIPDFHKDITGEIGFSGQNTSGFLFSNNLSNWKGSLSISNSTSLPDSEIVRVLEDSSITSFNAVSNSFNLDIITTEINTTIRLLILGRGDSFGGSLPSFLGNLTALDSLYFGDFGNGQDFPQLKFYGNNPLPNSLSHLQLSKNTDLEVTVPTWFGTLNLNRFQSWSWQTQSRINTHVENFYSVVESTNAMTGSTYLRGLDYQLVNTNLNLNTNPRPSGTYEAPTGYIQGSANGTPTSPMQAIYVLVNQYNMTVTVLNELGNGKDIYTP